jgi:hypothetical protein
MAVQGLRWFQAAYAPHRVYDPVHCMAIGAHMCANGHAVCWRMKHGMENDLLTVFFVKLGKWEMLPYIARLPSPRYKTRVVLACLPFSLSETKQLPDSV